nr:putative G3BP-like protein [Ipomoea batatas]
MGQEKAKLLLQHKVVRFKSAKKAIEAQAITIKGKAANISYKRFGRNARASTDDNDNRGRSPSGRGISHNKAPLCNGHSSNCETRHSGANQHNNNKGHKSSYGAHCSIWYQSQSHVTRLINK